MAAAVICACVFAAACIYLQMLSLLQVVGKGLSALTQAQLSMPLDKSLQCSTWGLRPLTQPQVLTHPCPHISRQASHGKSQMKACNLVQNPLRMWYMSDSLCASHAPPHSLHHTLQTLSVNGFCHHTLFRHGLALAHSAYTRICWMSACRHILQHVGRWSTQLWMLCAC